MKKINLMIKGMHCKSCAKLIESELRDKVKQALDRLKQKSNESYEEKKPTYIRL